MNWDLALAVGTGLFVTWLARFAVAPLVASVKRGIPVPSPSASIETKWKKLVSDPDTDRSGAWLGDLERALLFLALWPGAYEVVAGWFAFKVAAKWEAWSTLGALPESLDGADQLSYLIAKRRWASQRLMSFLVGAIANVLVAFFAMLAARHLLLPLLLGQG